MRSEGSRFTWGSGGEAVFAKSCVCVRNRLQPSATVCVTAVRLSTVASASGVVPKSCQVDPSSPQYAAVILGFAEEVSVWVICVAAVILAFAEEVSVGVICVAAFILAFAEEVSVRVICVDAVVRAFAEEMSVSGICVAAVILAFAEEVSVGVTRKSVKKECLTRVSSKKCQVRVS